MKDKVIQWFVRKLPYRVLYFALIQAWAVATTKVFPYATPDDLGWSDTLVALEYEEERYRGMVENENLRRRFNEVRSNIIQTNYGLVTDSTRFAAEDEAQQDANGEQDPIT